MAGTDVRGGEDIPVQRDADMKDVQALLERHNHDRGALIAILEEIQEHDGYLSEQALRTVSEQMDRSLVDVYGVATFYGCFRLQPRGKHLITVCQGTAAMSVVHRKLSKNWNGNSASRSARPLLTENTRSRL